MYMHIRNNTDSVNYGNYVILTCCSNGLGMYRDVNMHKTCFDHSDVILKKELRTLSGYFDPRPPL